MKPRSNTVGLVGSVVEPEPGFFFLEPSVGAGGIMKVRLCNNTSSTYCVLCIVCSAYIHMCINRPFSENLQINGEIVLNFCNLKSSDIVFFNL